MVQRSTDHRNADENRSRIPEGCHPGAGARLEWQMVFRMRAGAERPGTPPGCEQLGVWSSGGIAALNPRLMSVNPAGSAAAAGGGECGEGDGVWLRYAALVFKPLVHWGKPSGERRLRLTSCHSSKLGGDVARLQKTGVEVGHPADDRVLKPPSVAMEG